MADLFSNLLGQVDSVRIESAYGPTIELDQPFAPGPPNAFLAALKPKVTLSIGGTPYVMAPYGEPGPTLWPWIASGLLLALIGLGAFWISRR